MLPGDERIRRSGAFPSRVRRVLRHVGFVVATTATACWRRGPRGCWASVVRLAGLPVHWAPIESSRRRFSSSMDFLEQFRQGPETQSEWNILLWRVSFPMVALVLFTLLAVLGKFGHRIYSFLVCPVWYFSQFVLVAHPFLLVFKFHESDAAIRKRSWHVLALLSVAISLLEWFLSSPPDTSSRPHGGKLVLGAIPATLRARFLRHSWIVANTVFGVIALVAIPRYFYLQRRVIARDPNESLTALTSATAFVLPPLSPVVSPPASSHGSSLADASLSPRVLSPRVLSPRSSSLTNPSSSTPPTSSRGGSSARAYASILVSSSSSSSTSVLADLKRRSRAVFLLTGGCALLVWVAMVSSYSSLKTPDVISKYWFTIYMFSPIVCGLLIFVLRGQSLAAQTSSSNASSSFDFVAIYSILIVHLPVFLGHLCFRLFTIIELADPAHPAHAEARGIDFAGTAGSGPGVSFSASTSWMKLGISVVYLLVMQTYFYAMTQVVNSMAEPFTHPSLLYLGQLYYYLFWYVLVGSDTPIDALYWGMLLVNNIHIAFLNTGIYADVKQTSTSCFSPLFSTNLGMFKGSSMAMCFRATTITIANVTATSAGACKSTPANGLGKRRGKTEKKDSPRHQGASAEGYADILLSRSDLEAVDSDESAPMLHRASRRHHASKNVTEPAERADSPGSIDPNGARRTPDDRKSSWKSLLTMPTRSFLAFGGAPSASATGESGMPSSSATIYFKQCTCSQTNGCSCSQVSTGGHTSSCGEPSSRSVPAPSIYQSKTNVEQLRPLYFLMKLAEQDNMADTTALILVPSLLTLLAVLEKPSHGLSIVADQLNLWIRCIFMFGGRMAGAYLAREIFAYKLRSRLRQQWGRRDRAAEDAVLTSVEGVSTRLWIQRLMLQDFHRHFWYLTIVTIVVTFACFERMEVPARFTLLT